ncbi:hypothetical protein [Mediterraneibacter glycyrrhizinilyticus]|uniref:hypothetical protein n=1 Tax=Mediterraneibacter glycyrrhizinilyticus TaxID=342942 RepID=UPI0025AA78B7|nr:hypothetical protein [Mediterraneibacter glycyrrhizinilyticus]MDN0044588.1 hypothetical protein [Mediterraneibacter glycyrrhizinilyticus]
MDKRVWEQPMTMVQKFEANEYVAACGDTEYGKYLFTCNAPRGILYYYDWRGRAHRLGSYVPCDDKHRTYRDSEFPDGFVDYNRNGKEDKGEAVIVWLERGPFGGIWDGHATTNLDRDSWETAKS